MGSPGIRPPRIGIVGLFGECNAFRTAVPADEYEWMAYYEGAALLRAVADPAVFLLPETRGFFEGMNDGGPWTPVPLLYAASASGPGLDEVLLERLFDRLKVELQQAGPLDGIYVSGHGSVVGTRTKDVDAVLLEILRRSAGARIPIVETLDPHGKVTREMLDRADLLIAIRTDPHVDNHARGIEAAILLRRLLAGERPHVAYVRLPIMIPTIGMVAAAAPFRPAVEIGESRMGGDIANVSILPSYPWTDTPFAGLHVVVSGWRAEPVEALALELAEYIWERREGFDVRMATCGELVTMATALSADPNLPSVCFADVADNPGGGALGNTMHAVEALADAAVAGVVVGAIHAPEVAAAAHAAGVGATIDVVFNREIADPFSKPFAAKVTVRALADGRFNARSGVAKGIALDQGPTAALAIGELLVVVNSRCLQTFAAEQLEMVGVDLRTVRAVVVKSRGHYQSSFGEFFTRERMKELDLPGWQTPRLEQLPYRFVPRPLYPLDRETHWTPALSYRTAPSP